MIFKDMRSSGPLLACGFAVLLGLNAPAAEAVVTYSFTNTTGNAGGQTYTASGNPSVTLTGWSNGGTGGTLTQGSLTFWGSSGVGVNNGFGNTTADPGEGLTPEHAIDNSDLTDAVLLDFGAGNLFKMNSFSIGWYSTDADITLLAYTGSGTPTSTTLSGLLSNGWTGKNYWDTQSSIISGSNAINTNLTLSSRYWLVLAYNSAFTNLSSGSTVNSTTGADYFKFKSVSGDFVTTNVPLPATTALLGIGALALWRRSRNRRQG